MVKNHIVYNNFSPWIFELSKAEGSYIWDQNGKKYIDFTSGWNVTNLGWNNPEVNEAIAKQATKNVYAPMWTNDPIQNEYATLLTSSLPKGLDAVCRATGGTESVEMSIKIARSATGRKKIIGFADTYHGQLFAAMALGWRPPTVTEIAPLVPEFIQMELPYLPSQLTEDAEKKLLADFLIKLEELLKKEDIAALVTEAGIITGWGSVYKLPKGYLIEVRRLAKQYGTLLILDEVGTGFSRTGKLFGYQHENVIPDIMTFAKGISNGGAAIGAVVASSDLIEKTVDGTNLTSTFGWTPVACAAALKTLEIHTRDKVWEQAETKGNYMLKRLQESLLEHPNVADVRGLGLEIGIELVKDKKTKEKNSELYKKVITTAIENGLHIIGDSESVLQVMPPLTIPQDVLDKGINLLIQSIKNI